MGDHYQYSIIKVNAGDFSIGVGTVPIPISLMVLLLQKMKRRSCYFKVERYNFDINSESTDGVYIEVMTNYLIDKSKKGFISKKWKKGILYEKFG